MKIFIKHLNTGQETDDVNITWARSFDLFGCYLHGYLHCLIPLSIYLLLSTQHTYSNTTNSVSFLKKRTFMIQSMQDLMHYVVSPLVHLCAFTATVSFHTVLNVNTVTDVLDSLHPCYKRVIPRNHQTLSSAPLCTVPNSVFSPI